MRNTTKAVLVAIVILSMIAVAAIPASAAKPTIFSKYPPMAGFGTNTNQNTGSVYGQVTANNTYGISGAYIAIVNASNPAEEYANTTSDSTGHYRLVSVNSTWDGGAFVGGLPNYLPIYQMYANSSVFGEGLSNMFFVGFNSTAGPNIVITPVATHIKLTADKYTVTADGSDRVKVTAYVTDALGDPAADGTQVNFTINLNQWYDLTFNGTLNGVTTAPGQNTYTAGTRGGYVNVTFGWVPETNTAGLYNAGNNSTITGSFAANPLVNDSVKIFFQPAVVSWFGSVVDSYGKAQGGIPVQLHLMGLSPLREIYVMNATTLQDQPYPGSYVIDNILLWPNISCAYATANWTLTDGTTPINGASQIYSLNQSKTSSGFIVLHVPLPDQIDVTANPYTILVGGDISVITAQLMLGGQPYHYQNQLVYFYVNNTTVGYLTAGSNITDASGKATVRLISNMTKGIVRITGYSTFNAVTNLSDYADVRVVGWGTISGMVTDRNKNGIPNATVTLWTLVPGSATNGTYINLAPYSSAENPQYTVSRPEVAAIGTYTYYRIPSDVYNVTAEKTDASGNNHIWFAIVHLDVGTATNNVAIPDLVITTATPAPTAAPTAAPTVTVTPTPAPTATPTPTPGSPGFELVFALAGLLGVGYLVSRK